MPIQARYWYRDRPALHRVATDAALAELLRLRGTASATALSWSDDMSLDSFSLPERRTIGDSLSLLFGLVLTPGFVSAQRLGDWLDLMTAAFDAQGGAGDLTFRSSGSTGEPKAIRHSWDRFAEELEFQAGLHEPAGTNIRRVVGLVPSHHIYGFMFVLLLPQRYGAAFIDMRGMRPTAIVERLQPGDLVVGFPQIWQSLSETRRPMSKPMPRDVRGITSTAPCPPETARAVKAAGFTRLVELYGSSETAGIGWRDTPETGFTLFPYWRFAGGTTMLRHRSREQVVALPDHLAVADQAGRFVVVGRRDGAIQIGGMNVHPDHVAAVLRQHPAIADARVRPYRVGRTLRLKAFLVPRDAAAELTALRRTVEDWLRRRLLPIERPRHLTFGTTLPEGAMGKAADWDIATTA
jgi:long-chain acyl-CoA synthetase